jgi:hypothetical protein
MAALQRPDVREAVEHRVRQLSYEAAARLWVEGKVVSETARLLLPVILAQDPRHPLTGYQAHRYERASLVRSMIEQLPESERRHWIHHAEHQSAVRRAMLTGAALSDEELLACLPEVTRSAPVTPEQTPPLLEYLRRYPQLIKLAKSTLVEAATQLVRDGWSPNQAAQTGQWAGLVTVARVVEDRDLIEALVRAAVFDNPSPSIITEVHGANRFSTNSSICWSALPLRRTTRSPTCSIESARAISRSCITLPAGAADSGG